MLIKVQKEWKVWKTAAVTWYHAAMLPSGTSFEASPVAHFIDLEDPSFRLL